MMSRILSLHLLWPFFITIGGAEQPAALTQQTDIVILFALQIDKIPDFPVLHITFPGY
jgi:hypothetical protein